MEFAPRVLRPSFELRTWKGNTVLDGSTYNISNKCYNGVIYSSQCLSIDYIVRHDYKDPPTIEQVVFNGDILSSCTQPLVCEVVNSSEAAGCESCSKCPSPGVPGGYETYDHAAEQFSQLWGNITELETPVSNGSASTCSAATCSALEANVTALQEKLVQLENAITALQTPTVFSCYNTPEITSSQTMAPYGTCSPNVESVVDKTTGKFTVAKAGKYRLTFVSLMYPLDMKKVIAIMMKTSGGTETKLARALAQSKIGDEQEQVTISLDIITELAVADTIHVFIMISGTASIPASDAEPFQTFFTGEFISA